MLEAEEMVRELARRGWVGRIQGEERAQQATLGSGMRIREIGVQRAADRLGRPFASQQRSGEAMGECGKHGFCGFNAPIACYTCKSFEAWLEGPHEAVLNHLMQNRERLLKTSDKRIASINDRTIFAVAAVIQRCAEFRAEQHVESVRTING